MLRNLLYSFFFHILFIGLLFLSTVEFETEIFKEQATPLTINFLNENAIDDIKKIKTEDQDSRVKNLSIEEKIDLYNKVKAVKDAEKNNKIIYEKSTKKIEKRIAEQENNANNSEENEFSYHYTPVYVAEDKVNTEEKRKLIENRLKREELRKKIKERNIIPNIDVKDMKQIKSMQEIIQISQRPLVVKKNKKEEKKFEKDEKIQNDNVSEDNSNLNVDEFITEITVANNVIDDKYKGLSEDKIFSDEDYKKLKEMEENKLDSKYMLSLREKRNIQRQIKGCYKLAILRSKKDSKAIVALTVKVGRDGIINMNNIKVNKIVDNFDKNGFEIALENAKSALVFCSPLRGLPAGKYRTWKQMTFVFDSNNLE